ncbi:MAG: hypothetical protein KDN19_07310 [Verrucomicrobiae bacterium]|nr:hypothetical protein [Verrucomicrobiae bacterium]
MNAKAFPASRRKQRAFSLIEMTLAMTLAMGVAAATVVTMQQHVNFLRIMNRFNFLRDEAPTINLLLSRIIQEADSYRVYPSKTAAMNGAGAVNSGGTALWLRFRNPDGTFRQAAIVFETIAGDTQLNYYNKGASTWPVTPDWTISSQPAQVTFANDTGVLLITVTGPENEEITYVGNAE